MATLNQAYQNAKKLSNLDKLLFNYIRSIEGNFLNLNKSQLYDFSSDIFGNPLGEYSEATEYLSTHNSLMGRGNKIKYAGDPFTLVDTGDFFKGFYMKIVGDRLVFGSTDPKTLKILFSEFILSDELFGLTDDNLNLIISQNLLPFIQLTNRKILNI